MLFDTATFDLACFVVVASIFGIGLACIVTGFLATALAYSDRLEGSSVVSVVVVLREEWQDAQIGPPTVWVPPGDLPLSPHSNYR